MTSQNKTALDQLQRYREQIDAIDNELVSLITQRSQIVCNVKTLKDTHWPKSCHIRAGREAQMHADMFQRLSDAPIGGQAGAELWRLLISASTMIESALKIGHLNSTEANAKCYFSLLAHYIAAQNADDIIALFEANDIDIACLPFPNDEQTATDLIRVMQAHQDVRIFAYAPVVLQQTGMPHALIIGRVDAEESGDDWSYFLIDAHAETANTDTLCAKSASGQIIYMQGYHATHPHHENARFLGAHGTPVLDHQS